MKPNVATILSRNLILSTLARRPGFGIRRQRPNCARKLGASALIAAMTWLVFQAMPGHAAVTTVSHWRMGENDTGMYTFGGALIATNFTDLTGNHPLPVWGLVPYSTNVSVSASNATESSMSADFLGGAYATNGIVSTVTDNFGIECWVKPTESTTEQIIAYNGNANSSGWGMMIHQTNYCGLFGGVLFIGAVPVVTNVWTHLALVRASGTTTFYVNGVPAATTTATPNTPATLFALGASPQASAGYLSGYLDEVRVFTFVTNQFSTSDLLLNWKLYVDTTELLEGAAAGSDAVFLGAPSSFIAWTNSANAGWLHLGTQSGTGSTNIGFSVDANPGGTRVGTMTIAGQTVTVTQAGVTYVQATQIGTLFNNITAAGMAVDPTGNVYATSGGAVYRWSPGNASATPFITSGLSTPTGLARDNANNLYIANRGGDFVAKWIAASNTVIQLFSTPPEPTDLALDFAGNVYFDTDGTSNSLGPLKWSPVSGNITPVLNGQPAYNYSGLAVDASSDIFLGFQFMGGGIVNELTAGGTYSTISTSFKHPTGISVDRAGTLYVSDNILDTITKISAPPRNTSTIVSGLFPGAVATDIARNFYYSDSGVSPGVKELPYALVDASGRTAPADAGKDSLPAVLPVTANLMGAFAPTTDQPWLSIMGITNGVIYYSFTANTNVARTGHILVLGQSISVQQQGASFVLGTTNLLLGPGVGNASVVLFATPQTSTWTASADVPWLQLIQTNGAGSTNLIFTYNQNMGATRAGTITVAGQTITVTQAGVNYVPASAGVPLTASLSNSPCVAVDGARNVYFADTNGFIDYWSPTNQTTTILVSNLVNSPASLAIDSTNNLYFSEPSNHSILEWSAGMVSTVLSNATMIPQGLAIDTAGGIYFFDASDNAVKKWSAANNELYVIVTNVSGTTGIAVDAARNLYLVNGPGSTVRKWNSVSGALLTLFSGLSNPQGVAVDGSGNVYVADTQANAIRKWSAADGTINKLVFPGLNTPAGIAVDQAQNLYAADSGNRLIKELPYAMIDSSGVQVPLGAGNGALPTVLPPEASLVGIFAPTVDQPWLTITGATNGVVSFSFTANDTGTNRIANINVLGQDVLILQGQTTTRLGIDHRLEGPAAGVDSVLVAVTPDAGTWTATANASWLHLAAYSQSGNGSGLVVFNFDANPATTRTGTLTIGGQTFTVIQAGANYVQAGGLTSIPVPVAIDDVGINTVGSVATDTNGYVYYNEDQLGDVWRWSPSNQTATTCAGVIGLAAFVGMTSSDNGILCTADLLNDEQELYIGFGLTNAPPYGHGGGGASFQPFIPFLIPPPLPPGIVRVRSAVAEDASNFYFVSSDDPSDQHASNAVLAKITITNFTSTNYCVCSVLSSNYWPLGGIARDRAGNIYFGNDSTALKWSAKSKTTAYIPLHATTAIGLMAADGAGDVYAGTPSIFDPGSVSKLTAATGVQTTPVASGLNSLCGVAVDDERNIFVGDRSVKALKMLPYVFVDPTPVTVSGNAGGGSLPQVLPVSAYLLPPFVRSDQPWLTITGTNNGIVSFSVTANNTGSNRVAHINLFNQSIAVTQGVFITPPVLDWSLSSSNTLQFTFTNNQTTAFTVLTTTNLSLPLSNWTSLGAPANIGPGVFQFTTPITNDPMRFYSVSSP